MAKNKTIRMIDNSDEVNKRIDDVSHKRILAATMEWHASLMNVLTGTRNGRAYRIPGSNRTYRASMPGEPPAQRTGALRASYRFRVVEQSGELIGEVGSPLDYALYLEFGTSRMAPREHLYPAYDIAEYEIMEHLGRTWF